MTNSYLLVQVFAFICSLSLTLALVCQGLVWWVVRRKKHRPSRSEAVTVLKPLCGLEPQLAENLQSLARQTHRNLQIIVGIATSQDRALPVARKFCESNPMLETLLSVGAEPSVLNPKVSLLQRMTRSARGQWLVVSDSNVRVAPSYVEDALAQAEPDVGLITHLVAGGGGHGLGACLERLQLNAMIAPGICGARFLVGRTCVVGKSMFIRVDALRAIGGFRSAGGFLAEDYQLGCAIEKAGYRVVLANTPIMAWHPSWTIEKFVRRHLRWSIMRRKISPMGYCLEVFLNPGPFFLVLLALAVCLPDSPLDARWAALGFIAAQGLAALTSGTLSGPKTMALALVVNPLRECFSLALWVAGWWASRIEWRGKSYWVGPGTRLTEERHDSPKGVGDEA